MKVAINIDSQRNTMITDMIRNSAKNAGLLGDIEFRACNTVVQLRSYSPDILVSHVNSILFDYILQEQLSIKWLHLMSAGVDKLVIPFGHTLAEADVKVSSVKGIHGIAMREYVMAMILYFEKDLARWVSQKEKHSWDRKKLSCLFEKSLLVYGAGNIGQSVAKAASAFGMKVTGVSKSGTAKEGFDSVVKSEFLSEVVSDADYILVAAPRTELTDHVFNKEIIDRCKAKVVIINISRGELLDELYLAKSIEEGRVFGAALDVFLEEPLPATSPLWSVTNLIITPHISGSFDMGMEYGVSCFIDNLISFKSGNPLPTEVSLIDGY